MSIFKELINTLESYAEDREIAITRYAVHVAKLAEECEKRSARIEIASEIAKQLFEERAKIRDLVSLTMNISIKNGDVGIAKIAMTIYEAEYKKDLFSQINEAYGGKGYEK